MGRLVIKIILGITIAVLAYFIIRSILEPIRFNRERARREAVVIGRLKDIRTAQLAFKDLYGSYAGNFDILTRFVKTGTIPVLRMLADSSDTTFTRIISDTIRRVRVIDSLFPGRPPWFADSLRFVPFSEGVGFEMDAGEIEKGKVTVPVFEVSVALKDFLYDLNEDLYDSEGGLTLGSMMEPITNGNWE